MRYARQRDRNEREIIAALRAIGAVVTQLGEAGVPDLLVGYQGCTILLEVKLPLQSNGNTPVSRSLDHKGGRGDLTKAQVAWWDSWKGAPAVVVRSVEEAIAAVRGDRSGLHVRIEERA